MIFHIVRVTPSSCHISLRDATPFPHSFSGSSALAGNGLYIAFSLSLNTFEFLPLLTDTEQKKTFSMSEASVEPTPEPVKSLGLPDADEPSLVSVKIEEPSDESSNHVSISDNATTPIAESSNIETNNNGCESSAEVEEIGPTLRSKTKARNSDSSSDVRSVDGDSSVKTEDSPVSKPAAATVLKTETGETGKKPVVAKLADMSKIASASASAPKSRRSSLNIDVRRSSLYGEKLTPDGGSKSQIDEMIDKIKLTIAKTIESKIYKPDSKGGLLLGKSFEVPKIEEIVAPLSNDTTTPKIEKETDEEKPNASKSRGEGYIYFVLRLFTLSARECLGFVLDVRRSIVALRARFDCYCRWGVDVTSVGLKCKLVLAT